VWCGGSLIFQRTVSSGYFKQSESMDRLAPGISNPQRTAGFQEGTNNGSFPAFFSRFYDFLIFFFPVSFKGSWFREWEPPARQLYTLI